jgi:hypothetical protein
MTTRARMMALIDTFADESPLVREIAGWVVSGKIDDAIDADTDERMPLTWMFCGGAGRKQPTKRLRVASISA